MLLLFIQLVTLTQAQCTNDTVIVNCGNTLLFFETQRYDTGKIALVHMHENETDALQAALWLIDSVRQGSATTWHGQLQRFINFSIGSGNFRFDPNRIYTDAGIRTTLAPNTTDTVLAVVQAIADIFLRHFIIGKKQVIALHNNTNKGGLTIKSYAKSGPYFKDVKAVYTNPLLDEDDFFYTTEERYFRYLKNKHYNAVLQNNEQVTDDGSLSVYCARHSICYINIEAQNEHLQQQKEMLGIIWEMIKIEDPDMLSHNRTLEDN